jgi:hypothetical protein
MAELDKVMGSNSVHTIVFFLALYGSAFTAQQMANLGLAAWPFPVSIHALYSVLCERPRPAAASDGALPAAAAGSGGGGRAGAAPEAETSAEMGASSAPAAGGCG